APVSSANGASAAVRRHTTPASRCRRFGLREGAAQNPTTRLVISGLTQNIGGGAIRERPFAGPACQIIHCSGGVAMSRHMNEKAVSSIRPVDGFAEAERAIRCNA